MHPILHLTEGLQNLTVFIKNCLGQSALGNSLYFEKLLVFFEKFISDSCKIFETLVRKLSKTNVYYIVN